jgi:signal transduction histidine kinase
MFVDGEKLAWALATLVGNALRAFDHQEGRKHPAHITLVAAWNPEGRALDLTVRDTGRGMPESRSRWLFEQDPSTGRSAGLALSMVRDVMVAHRGSVSVQSTVGAGTSITLHVPRLDPGTQA